jgi:pimeloyl-ACP methyl ester carboxylesterase
MARSTRRITLPAWLPAPRPGGILAGSLQTPGETIQRPVTVATLGSRIGGLLGQWRYAEAGRRDVRLDFLRGYAVFAMISDHVGGISWFSPLTGSNRFLTSAAEGFVFLAGLVIGMVYGPRIKRDGWLPGAEAILRRAGILYAVTVGLTLLFVALFQFTDLRLWLDREYGLGLTDPVELVVGTLTLHYTYHGTDILWMYTILIAAAPLLFLFLEMGRTWWVLVASWLLWLAYQFFPSQAAIPWVATNVNYFPVASWQLVFVNGLLIGYHREAVARVFRRISPVATLVLFGLGMAYLILVQWAHDHGRLAGWPVAGRLAGELYLVVFDKPTVAIGRILAFIVLAGFAYSLVTVLWVPMRRALGWLLLPLGTSSLRAYGTHLLVIVLVYNVDSLARLYDRSRTANTVLQAVTVGLTLGVIILWKRAEEGIDWRVSLPRWPTHPARRPALIGAASTLVLALTVAGAIYAGPVRASRQATMESGAEEAGVLRFVPRERVAQGPLPVLLALHDEGETGPEMARALVDVARENGWVLIAPTIPYAEWSDPNLVAADAAAVLPRLDDLIEGLDEHAEITLRPQILVLGRGRGAHTAQQLALFYPEKVAAVATVGPAPCILPAESVQGTPLPFPLGVDDLEQYTGDNLDGEAVARTPFWIGIANDGRSAAESCPWGALAEQEPAQRAQTFARQLESMGSRVETVSAADAQAVAGLPDVALAFLRANQPRTE